MTDLKPYEQIKNTIEKQHALYKFLKSVLPDEIPNGAGTQSKEQFIEDVFLGIKESTMAVRITQVGSSSLAGRTTLTLRPDLTFSAVSTGRTPETTRSSANSSPCNHYFCQTILNSPWTLCMRNQTRL